MMTSSMPDFVLQHPIKSYLRFCWKMTNVKLLHQLYASSLQNSREILTADAKNLRSCDVGLKFGKYAPFWRNLVFSQKRCIIASCTRDPYKVWQVSPNHTKYTKMTGPKSNFAKKMRILQCKIFTKRIMCKFGAQIVT